jgi:predicted negative regulator of RcsB-dependent stress response
VAEGLPYIVRRSSEIGLPFMAAQPKFSAFYMEVESSQAPSQPMDFYNVANWFHKNQRRVVIGALVVFAIGAIIAIVVWHNNKVEADANDALMALPSTFGGPNYPHPTAPALQNIAKEYPGTPAGEQAEILAANVLFTDGKYAEAQQAFEKFNTDHANSPLAAQANLGIAASMEGAGKANDAIGKYKEVITRYPSEPYIINPAKLTLARLLEVQNKPDEALRYYDDLMRNQNQYDPWAGEARERREFLLAKHPELNKPVATPSSTPSMAQPGQSAQPKPLQLPPPTKK